MKTNYNNLIERLLKELNDIQDDIYFCTSQRTLKQLESKERKILNILEREFDIKLKSVF